MLSLYNDWLPLDLRLVAEEPVPLTVGTVLNSEISEQGARCVVCVVARCVVGVGPVSITSASCSVVRCHPKRFSEG